LEETIFMSGDKVFIDTNILVYAYDASAGAKHSGAQQILAELWNSGLGVVSTQVLEEFFVTVTRKLPKPIDLSQAREIVSDLLKWEAVTIDGDTILDAIDIHRDHGISFWDSLILATAASAGCTVLYSEDLSSGRIVGRINIKNPFQQSY
jgi:predicted nucleic acid-binding protein